MLYLLYEGPLTVGCSCCMQLDMALIVPVQVLVLGEVLTAKFVTSIRRRMHALEESLPPLSPQLPHSDFPERVCRRYFVRFASSDWLLLACCHRYCSCILFFGSS